MFFAGLPVDLTTKKPIEAGLARILRRHNTLNDKHSATKQLDLSDEHQRRPKEYKKECCSATFTLQLTSLPLPLLMLAQGLCTTDANAWKKRSEKYLTKFGLWRILFIPGLVRINNAYLTSKNQSHYLKFGAKNQFQFKLSLKGNLSGNIAICNWKIFRQIDLILSYSAYDRCNLTNFSILALKFTPKRWLNFNSNATLLIE